MGLILKALGRAVLWTAALAVSFYLVHVLGHPAIGTTVVPSPDTQAAFIHGLLAQHHCWTGGSGHPIPGHVVAYWHGSIHYGGRHLTKVALDSIFTKPDPRISVIGFCR